MLEKEDSRAANSATIPQGNFEQDEKAPLLQPSSGIGRLGIGAVVALVFFNVSGGPIGGEGMIRDGGPIIGLCGLVVVVLVYSIPSALMTAELSTAFPRNGGYSIWVKEAFGNFWGLQESYYSWGSGVVDNALYPILLYSSAKSLFSGTALVSKDLNSCQARAQIAHQQAGGNPSNLFGCVFSSHDNCAAEYFSKLSIVVIFTAPTLLTNSSLGINMVVLMVFVLAPFVVMCIVGIPQMEASNWLPLPTDIPWVGLFNIIFWNVSGFDCCSTFSHEVDRPIQRTLPRALGLALIIMVLGYVLPLGIGAAVVKDWRCWIDGSLPHVAQQIGGNWLGIWVFLATIPSNWAQYSSELFEDAHQMLGLGEVGLLPKFFTGRSSLTGTPVNAILFQAVIIGVMIGFDFSEILVIDNFFYAASNVLEFAALIKLRIYQPDLERPYKIPMGTTALVICYLPAISIAIGLLVINASKSSTAAWVCLGGTLLGIPLCAYGSYASRDEQFHQLTVEEPQSEQGA